MNNAHPADYPCIICGTELTAVFDQPEQPDNGLNVRLYGAYGTTVFDPLDGSFLTFNICDPCIVQAGRQGRIILGNDDESPTRTVWNPDDEY